MKEEQVTVDKIYEWWSVQNTTSRSEDSGRRLWNAPVTVMKTAGEGGPWGMAVLASYMLARKRGKSGDFWLTAGICNQNRRDCGARSRRCQGS
ncbi:MAG: hypothetical protein V8S22_03320 [Lachnospiraceae bacterium]